MQSPAHAAPSPTPAAPNEPAEFLAANPDIELVELLLPDTNGIFRGKWVPPSHLAALYKDGLALAKSVFAVDAWGRDVLATGLFHETGDRDGCARPVPGTLRRMPWAERPTAQLMLRMADEDGQPFFADPRTILERAAAALAARGLFPVVAFELEFYLLELDEAGRPVFAGSAGGPDRSDVYSMADLRTYGDLFAEIETTAHGLGVPTDTIISEAAARQFEVNLRHVGDPVAAADHALLLRRIVRRVAHRHGLRASFMAKPFVERSGNGMHVHLSLTDRDGRNVYGAAPDGEALLHQSLGGLLATMADAALPFVSTFNGFRRLAGPYTPSKALWAENNRYVALRLPRAGPSARRIEHRVAGADANPHLVLAAILAGVARGLDRKLGAPPPVEGDAGAVAAEALPPTMRHALERFRDSDWVTEAFGAEWRDFYARVKDQELAGFEAHVCPLELDTYL